MKNIRLMIMSLIFTLGLISGCSSNNNNNNTPTPTPKSWQLVGTAGFTIDNISKFSFQMSNGEPYLAYISTASQKVTLQHFRNGFWNNVGAPDFSGNARDLSLYIYGANTYIAYRNMDDSDKINVIAYNGASWTTVGGTAVSDGEGGNPSLTINSSNGIPYVVYKEKNGSNIWKTTVKYLSYFWVLRGNRYFSTGANSYYNSISVNNGIVRVAYTDDASGKPIVMRNNGATWVQEGSDVSVTGFAYSTQFGVDGSTLYLAYIDYVNPESAGPVCVQKFDGSNWESLGVAGSTESPASTTEDMHWVALGIDQGIPYVAFRDVDNSNRVTVKKYASGSWSVVGASGFSPNDVNTLEMCFSGGTPYVAFIDSTSTKPTVMKYE